MLLASPFTGEGALAEPYDVEQAVQQPASAGRGDGGDAVPAFEREALVVRCVGRFEDQLGVLAAVPHDPAAEPLTGVGQFAVDRVGPQPVAGADQRAPAADRPERGRRQPGRVEVPEYVVPVMR